MRDDRGFTLIEVGVAAMIGAIVLALASTLLVLAQRTGAFTQGQGQTLNNGRNALQQLEKEIRSADAIFWCTPLGSCIQIDAQKPSGGYETLRYTHADKELKREVFDTSSQSWSETGTLIQRVVNGSGDPVFSCEENTSLLRVTVDLQIEPTPQSDPSLNLHTSITPRNFSSAANCP